MAAEPEQVDGFDRVAEMRNDDGPSHDEGNIKRVVEFGIGEPRVDTLKEMVIDAVVAAEYHGCDEAEQFFRSCVKGTIAIGGAVECEKAFDAQMVLLLQDSPVHSIPIRLECVKAAGCGLRFHVWMMMQQEVVAGVGQ